MIKKLLLGITAVTALLTAYLLFWPVPLVPVAANPAQMPALTGEYKPNRRLANVTLLANGFCMTPEDIAFDKYGRIYSGMIDQGVVMRFRSDGSHPEIFAKTGGKPAGLVFDADGNLIVADAERGLLSITPDGSISVLTDNADGKKLGLVNAVDIDAHGAIYFSQTSTKFKIDRMFYDTMEHRPHGRLLVYSPITKKTSVLLKNLYFANGVAVSSDSSYVLVSETTANRITRYWLKGAKKGKSEIWIDNLPGFPDNIHSDGDDGYWVGIVDGPDTRRIMDGLLPHPFLRKIIVRLPAWMTQPKKPHSYAFVLGLSSNGKVSRNLQDPFGERYYKITSAVEHDGMLYLGTVNPSLKAIGRIKAP